MMNLKRQFRRLIDQAENAIGVLKHLGESGADEFSLVCFKAIESTKPDEESEFVMGYVKDPSKEHIAVMRKAFKISDVKEFLPLPIQELEGINLPETKRKTMTLNGKSFKEPLVSWDKKKQIYGFFPRVVLSNLSTEQKDLSQLMQDNQGQIILIGEQELPVGAPILS